MAVFRRVTILEGHIHITIYRHGTPHTVTSKLNWNPCKRVKPAQCWANFWDVDPPLGWGEGEWVFHRRDTRGPRARPTRTLDSGTHDPDPCEQINDNQYSGSYLWVIYRLCQDSLLSPEIKPTVHPQTIQLLKHSYLNQGDHPHV